MCYQKKNSAMQDLLKGRALNAPNNLLSSDEDQVKIYPVSDNGYLKMRPI